MTQVTITHIGGPTTLLEVAGWRLLTDPTFDPPGRRYWFGWGAMSKKLQGPAIAPADLGPIDAVLITHDQHGDNLDPTGRALLPDLGRVITTEPAAGRLGGNCEGLAPWSTTTLAAEGRPTIEITATPARHGPPGSRFIVGTVVGFALSWAGQENGPLWITGDSVLYDGLREVPRRIDVGTAVLHLGGVRFPVSGPVRYTMTAENAVELLGLVDPRTVVPVHYEGWQHFRQKQQRAEQVLNSSPFGPRVRWLPIGTATELTV